MDDTDAQLLAALLRDPLASQAALARAGGLTPNAARARLNKLEDEGVYRGVWAVPNPVLFDRAGLVCVYPPGSGEGLAIEDTFVVEAVVGGSINQADQFAAVAWPLEDEVRVPDGLDDIVGVAVERTFQQRPQRLDPPGAALSSTQWRVLEALIEAPRAPVTALAERAEVSTKVARRARSWLVDGGHVKLEPAIYANLAQGVLLYEIYVQGAAAEEPGPIQRAVGPSWVIDRLADPVGVLLLCRAKSLGDALEAPRRARKVPGVEHAELLLAQEGAYASEKLQAWCRAAREAWDETRGRTPA